MSNSEVNTIGEKVGGGVPNGVRSSSSVTGSTDTESIDSATVIIGGITKQEEMPAINVRLLLIGRQQTDITFWL